MKIRHMDHVGITVRDLDAAVEFFKALGMEVEGKMDLEGELVDNVTGLQGVKSTIVMLYTPDGGAKIELSQFHSPPAEGNGQNLPVNTVGIRHMSFLVEDIDGLLAMLKKRGTETFSEVQNYENIFKLCYVHGPEGIIVELAEKVRGKS